MSDFRSITGFAEPRAVGFDPVERAGLSRDQVLRMEQILIAVSSLKDGNGLCIIFEMDHWIAAQLTAALFDSQGQARTTAETFGKQFEGSKLQ